jgi:hypothetical protein
MTIDDDDLTPEEIKTLKAITAARIKALELKALKRLSMTDEEKAAFKLFSLMIKTPELRDFVITMLSPAGIHGLEIETQNDRKN